MEFPSVEEALRNHAGRGYGRIWIDDVCQECNCSFEDFERAFVKCWNSGMFAWAQADVAVDYDCKPRRKRQRLTYSLAKKLSAV